MTTEDGNYYEIDLDIWKQFPIKTVTIKQLDIGRKIRIKLYSNGYGYNLTNSQATLYMKKDGNNLIFNNCKVVDSNTLELEITSTMVEIAGDYNAEIDVISDGVSTFNFVIQVIETNKNTIQITQSSEYKALVDVFKKISNIDGDFTLLNSDLEKIKNELNDRIDNIVSTNNPTDGNSELIDTRLGDDAVTYESGGKAIRTQFKKIKEVVVPSYYPDFVKRANEINVTDKEITATFDSIKIIEKVDNNTNNRGFSIEIKPDVKKIRFDIDYLNFGVNCGLYYFAGTSLKASYKTINRGISSDLKSEKDLGFELDWNVINDKFTTLGADKLILIFWNVAGSKINGYNYIYNIKINDFMKLQNVCEKLLDLKEYTDESASNILFSSVKNEDTILAETKNLTRWGTTMNSTVTITDNVVTIEYNPSDGAGNTGAITNVNFTPPNSNFIKISGNVINFEPLVAVTGKTQGISIMLAGKSITDGSAVYKTISELLTKTGEFSYVVDLNYYGVYTDLDITKPLNVLIGTANGGLKSSIENFKITSNELLQCSELVGDTLTETTKNFDTSINSIENQLNALSDNKLVSPSGKKYITQVSDDGTLTAIPVIPDKTLIIGNSLLKGFGLTLDDRSKNIFGMCATSNESDYFYHLSQYIKNLNPSATFDKLGGDIEQAETQTTVDNWIANNITGKISDYDLVIVQLGDNVNNATRINLFKNWCKQLLQAIRINAPKARVVWVGEWYINAEREKIMTQSCIDTGCEFINITDIHSSKDSEATLDTVIIKDKANNITFLVSDYPNSTGVATHPNDDSHEKIALRIIEKLF